ncbi:MAG: hypothetical protein U5L45_13355 [Saprospiraceae bacterium]|nr:hypothetical protein [Saprospiraceae bacterium]
MAKFILSYKLLYTFYIVSFFARFACKPRGKKGSFFGQSPKNEPHSPPSRERSEREMQKTLLGYAHPSNIK